MNGIKIRLSKKSSWLADAEHSVLEQAKIYDDLLDDVMANPRWYLDQLSYLPEFKVSWINYKKQNATRPYKYVKTRNNNRNLYK